MKSLLYPAAPHNQPWNTPDANLSFFPGTNLILDGDETAFQVPTQMRNETACTIF
jgi:hypothetical protein